MILKFIYFIFLLPIFFGLCNSCQKNQEASSIQMNTFPEDKKLMNAFRIWKEDQFDSVEDLIKYLGNPVDTSSNEGRVTYSWAGSGKAWLYADVDPSNNNILGISVRDSY